MIDSSKNPMSQLNQASSQGKILAKECDVKKDTGGSIHIKDLYKGESYKFKTPGFLGLGKFAKELTAGEALDRLSKGKEVIVKEEVTLCGTYDNLDEVCNYRIKEQTVETSLQSVDDLESFARVESGSKPLTEKEQIAQMLERVEYKGKESGDTNFFEILGKDGKPISSTEAVRRVDSGEIIQLRERSLQGEHIVHSREATGNEQLKKNEKFGQFDKVFQIYEDESYVVRTWKIDTSFDNVNSNPTNNTVPFNSLDQLKAYLGEEIK